ncbi:MAG: GNAT family N-acetyltransferase [Pseudomonadota bacterium]
MRTDIRVAEPGDAPALAALCKDVHAWHSATYPDIFAPDPSVEELTVFFHAQFEDPDVTIFVAASPDRTHCAYLYARITVRQAGLFHRARRRLHIEHVGVAEPYRRQGHATALFDAARALAQRENCADLFLDTWEANTSAHAMFEAAGFTQQRRLYASPL